MTRLHAALVLVSCALACSAPQRTGQGTDGETTPSVSAAVNARAAAVGETFPSDLVGRARAFVTAALVGRGHALLTELCTVAPARLSGSESAQRAVEWGLGTMRRIGLENVRGEPVTVPHWVRRLENRRGTRRFSGRRAPSNQAVEAFLVVA